MSEIKKPHPSEADQMLGSTDILLRLEDALESRDPDLDDICIIAAEIAESRGRDTIYDPLLLLLKKFFTGDWRKKIGDQDEAAELLEEITKVETRFPIQDVLAIIKELSDGVPNIEKKIHALRDEISRLSHLDSAETIDAKKSAMNQLLADLEVYFKKISDASETVTLEIEYKIEIAQEVADLVYMLAKLKNVEPDKLPDQGKLDELFAACGGFTYKDALRFCYFKYGSRLLAGKQKAIEMEVMRAQVTHSENNASFDASSIDVPFVKQKMREILFEVIGVPERMVVVCDLTIHGTYKGTDVHVLVPRKQNFISSEGSETVVTYSNFMTTASVTDTDAVKSILSQLPTGTVASGDAAVINGYLVEKDGRALRIQGIPVDDQKKAAQILSQLELGIEASGSISFEVDVIREAFAGLPEDVHELSEIIPSLMRDTKMMDAWQRYGVAMQNILITAQGLRYVQTVPAINHFKSGRTNKDTHALLSRGELLLSEEAIMQLIESGVAQYVDSNTPVVSAPLLVVEADRKSGLLFNAATSIDAAESTHLPHSVALGKATFGDTDHRLAVTTSSLL